HFSEDTTLQDTGAFSSGSCLQLNEDSVDGAAPVQIAFIDDLSGGVRNHTAGDRGIAGANRCAVDHLGRRIAHVMNVPHHLVDEVTGLLRYIHICAFSFATLLHLNDGAHNDSQYS